MTRNIGEIMTVPVAIVTGASRGIGRACTVALAAAGFAVYLVADGTEAELAQARDDCTAAHPQRMASAFGIVDLANPDAARAIVAAALETFSRIDVPKSFAKIPAGKAAVAGVAWATNKGIEKVEVQIDDDEWQEARLPKEDSVDTWRQWVYEWEADAGLHSIKVRATDKTGKTQTSQRVAPRPNGATGWHTVSVTVA